MKKCLDWINKNKTGLPIVGIVLVAVPLAVYGLSVFTVLPNGGNDWSGFWGGYLGAIIGAAVAIYGVRATLEETRRQFKEDKRIEHAPLLKIEEISNKDFGGNWVLKYDENDNKIVGVTLRFKNIGLGSITKFEILNFIFTRREVEFPLLSGISPEKSIDDIIEVGSDFLIPIVIGINIPLIDKDESYLSYLSGESPLPMELIRSGLLSFDIKFRDILENVYAQHIELSLSCNIDNIKKGYDEPVLSLRNPGERQLHSRSCINN